MKILRIILFFSSAAYTFAIENLALNKHTWQYHAWPDKETEWGADKAVDGLYSDRSAPGNQCTISAGGQRTAEWGVDLGSVVNISYIKIYYRTDNNPGACSFIKRFAGFFLYVSNSTSREHGKLCFHKLQNVSGTPTEDQTINCSMYGRYVIYYNERRRPNVTYPSYYSLDAYNELCELEVYGCCADGYFGTFCNQSCPKNCERQQCHIFTGNCVNGCVHNYHGPQCSYLNLALRRPAWQQHNWPDSGKDVDWGAAKAVDGKYSDRSAGGNQCTISADKEQTAMWWVDLQRVVSISYINIYYRTDNVASPGAYYNRFAGFFLYVSNDTSKDNGSLCFHAIQKVTGTPSEDQTISCPYDGRYVIYYNERGNPDVMYPSYYSQYAYNELCELEVYGCPNSTYYGKYCDKLCPNICLDQRCNMSTGNCLECTPGYKGPHCSQECDDGMYGSSCSRTCGHCLHNTQCHHINGFCSRGCSAGYTGYLCNKNCDDGMYGVNCSQSCGHCLNDTQCHHINGTCLYGCSTGYKGLTCTNECDGGKYGVNCSQDCGNCRNDTQCHHINGTCLGGCDAGYMGLICINECHIGMYGDKCGRNCGHCINGTYCNPVDGSCLKGCSSGYEGSLCIKAASKQGKLELTNIYENVEGTSHFKDGKNSSKQSLELKTGRKECDDDIDNDEKLHEENPYGDLYINDEPIPDINIDQLKRTIKEKRKNEDDGFKKEYATMPYGERYPCNAGKEPENVPKNRYKTTFPYDHSRVKLSNSQSDYINANFIDGIDKTNEYIAAQGPRQNTVTDFWKMIWQENVTQIVMLTNLKEGNKAKCVKYWPDLTKSSTFGVISLRTDEEQSYANYKIRRIRVNYKGVSQKRMLITQYHYTTWPDHGTPEPLCLVVFHDHVTRTKQKQDGVPTVVHCSAGIGRTGTYIAIDALYKAGKTNRKINIAEYVKKMRENRMNMVQTYEQYMTIFLALDVMFKAPTCVQTKSEFLRRTDLMSRDRPANESELRKEFQNLLRVRPSYTEVDYTFALHSEKNKSAVLPLDKYSVFLSSPVPKRGNYINAVALPSYIKNEAFIVTRYPSPEDAVDFLRLLTDQDSDVVICFDCLGNIESTKHWLPGTNTSKSVSPLTVHCGCEQVTDIKCTTISISQEGKNEDGCSVSIIEPTGGIKKEDPQATAQMLRLVSFALQSETEGPITIVSSDGAVLCGVFCAVYNVLQQLSMDGEVDIFSFVRQLQIRRPELCSTMEEYKMIYDLVLHYIREQQDPFEENIYCNQ
ncbi:uncharacterized protein LOC133180387 [Saccostrea echinata]|uniref:uncharacterized protein LOC133180387 n=1 Tax=Saccostrea echinata TaxID=191078 RepID=UPI002A7F22E9|nr:uncharacterized protein LOC133180387 [Saccostrea echinata]